MWKLKFTQMLALALMSFLGGSMYAQSIDATVIAPRSENGTYEIQFSEWNNDIVDDLYDLLVDDNTIVKSLTIDEGNQMITVEIKLDDVENSDVEVWFENYLNDRKQKHMNESTDDTQF